jgi:hypothetical protein
MPPENGLEVVRGCAVDADWRARRGFHAHTPPVLVSMIFCQCARVGDGLVLAKLSFQHRSEAGPTIRFDYLDIFTDT